MTANHIELARLGSAYRRFLFAASLLSHVPDRWRLRAARLLGRHLSPYRARGNHFINTLQEALGLSGEQARLAWRHWLENHGLCAASVFSYASLDQGWLAGLIQLQNEQRLHALQSARGLILTAHCHHQNLLAAFLGLKCGLMHPLAADAKSSPLYPWIGGFIEKINLDSEKWFAGGRYLFIEPRYTAIRKTREVLATGGCVLALCDMPSAKSADLCNLFGRQLTPPNGAIRIALSLQVPIFAALLVPGDQGLVLHLTRLPDRGGLRDVFKEYSNFLEQHFRKRPECWQGWEWWSALPRPTIIQTIVPNA